MYAPIMKNEPWARFTTCSMPKISVRPAANKKIRSPYATPFSPWTMMKSGLTTPDSRAIMINVRSVLVALVFLVAGVGQDVGREVLAASDGWASAGSGTSGGASADVAHVFTVTDRHGLVAALESSAPKIVFVAGPIDGNVDDDNRALGCDDYAAAGYSLDGYLAAYDPSTWGKSTRPAGELEDLRRASQVNQAARVQVRVSPNTTIVGVSNEARLVGVNLVVSDVDNVIIRNLRFVDA